MTHDSKEPQFDNLEIMSRERGTLAKGSRRMEATQGLIRKELRTRWHHVAAFYA
ncbi:hypothetical protein [Bradyrhizobium erythrophlei]|jgi:hypothetical protein|uniref:Uncharacterized protein n=1 Tax=Bradyrhizobium erythrophlei TaxID=1437360 RepID=A0A1M5SG26_9BRAD|nr:hypothetical protein [Bradyrhizobium erythrophlei]SHH37494.1 hypothetical protein SAMN05444169_7125 [Bradyrhizobium erythrophlei]